MKKWMIWGENPPFKETPEIHRCSVSFCSYIFWRGTPGIRLGPPRWLHGYILPFTKDASHYQNPCLNPSYTFICHWPTEVFWSSVSSFFRTRSMGLVRYMYLHENHRFGPPNVGIYCIYTTSPMNPSWDFFISRHLCSPLSWHENIPANPWLVNPSPLPGAFQAFQAKPSGRMDLIGSHEMALEICDFWPCHMGKSDVM